MKKFESKSKKEQKKLFERDVVNKIALGILFFTGSQVYAANNFNLGPNEAIYYANGREVLTYSTGTSTASSGAVWFVFRNPLRSVTVHAHLGDWWWKAGLPTLSINGYFAAGEWAKVTAQAIPSNSNVSYIKNYYSNWSGWVSDTWSVWTRPGTSQKFWNKTYYSNGTKHALLTSHEDWRWNTWAGYTPNFTINFNQVVLTSGTSAKPTSVNNKFNVNAEHKARNQSGSTLQELTIISNQQVGVTDKTPTMTGNITVNSKDTANANIYFGAKTNATSWTNGSGQSGNYLMMKATDSSGIIPGVSVLSTDNSDYTANASTPFELTMLTNGSSYNLTLWNEKRTSGSPYTDYASNPYNAPFSLQWQNNAFTLTLKNNYNLGDVTVNDGGRLVVNSNISQKVTLQDTDATGKTITLDCNGFTITGNMDVQCNIKSTLVVNVAGTTTVDKTDYFDGLDAGVKNTGRIIFKDTTSGYLKADVTGGTGIVQFGDGTVSFDTVTDTKKIDNTVVVWNGVTLKISAAAVGGNVYLGPDPASGGTPDGSAIIEAINSGTFDQALRGQGKLIVDEGVTVQVGNHAAFDITGGKVITVSGTVRDLTPEEAAQLAGGTVPTPAGGQFIPTSSIDLDLNGSLTIAKPQAGVPAVASGALKNVTMGNKSHLNLMNDSPGYLVMQNITCTDGASISLDVMGDNPENIDSFAVLGDASGNLKIANLNVTTELMAGHTIPSRDYFVGTAMPIPVYGTNSLDIKGTTAVYGIYKYTVEQIKIDVTDDNSKATGGDWSTRDVGGTTYYYKVHREDNTIIDLAGSAVGSTNYEIVETPYLQQLVAEAVGAYVKQRASSTDPVTTKGMMVLKELGYNLWEIINAQNALTPTSTLDAERANITNITGYSFLEDVVNTAFTGGLGKLQGRVSNGSGGYMDAASREFTLNANGHALDGGGYKGVEIPSGMTLNINNASKIFNFKETDDGFGAVKNDGTLNVDNSGRQEQGYQLLLEASVTGGGNLVLNNVNLIVEDEYKITQGSLTLDDSITKLQIDAADLHIGTSDAGTIKNAGEIILTGSGTATSPDTLEEKIITNGVQRGILNVQTNLTASNEVNAEVIVAPGKTFSIAVSNMKGQVENYGTTQLTDNGFFDYYVTGTGTISVDGEITANKLITNKIVVEDGKKLTIGVENIGNIVEVKTGAEINLDGEYRVNTDGTISGDLCYDISGLGKTNIIGKNVFSVANINTTGLTIENNAKLTTSAYQIGTNAITVTDSGSIEILAGNLGNKTITGGTAILGENVVFRYNNLSGTKNLDSNYAFYEANVNVSNVPFMDKISISGKATGFMQLGILSVSAKDDAWTEGTAKSVPYIVGAGLTSSDSDILVDTTITISSDGCKYTFMQGHETPGDTETGIRIGYIDIIKNSGFTLKQIVENYIDDDGFAAGTVETYSLVADYTEAENLGTMQRVSEDTPRQFTIAGNNHKFTGGNHSGIEVMPDDTLVFSNIEEISGWRNYVVKNSGGIVQFYNDIRLNSPAVGYGLFENYGTLTVEKAANLGMEVLFNEGTIDLGGAEDSVLTAMVAGGDLDIKGNITTAADNLLPGTNVTVDTGKELTFTDGNLMVDIHGSSGKVNFAGKINVEEPVKIDGAVNFKSGSKLSVNGNNIMYGDAALSNFTSATFEPQAELYVAGAKEGITYTILDSVAGTAWAAGAGWDVITPGGIYGLILDEVVSDGDIYTVKFRKMRGGEGDTDAPHIYNTRTGVLDQWATEVCSLTDNKTHQLETINSMFSLAQAAQVQHSAWHVSDMVMNEMFANSSASVNPKYIRKKVMKPEIQNIVAKEGKPSDIKPVDTGRAKDIMPVSAEEQREPQKYRVWASYLHSKEKIDGFKTGSVTENSTAQYNGAIVGADLWENPHGFGGLAVSFVEGDIHSSQYVSTVRNESEYRGIGIYHNQYMHGYNIQMAANYIHTKNDISMGTAGPGVEVTAEPRADVYKAGLRVEKPYNVGRATAVMPFAGIKYTYLKNGSYRTSLGLGYDTDRQHTVTVPVGLLLRTYYDTVDGWRLGWSMESGYAWNLGDREGNQTLSNGMATDSIGFEYLDHSRYYMETALSASKDNAVFALTYRYSKGARVRDNRWMLNARFEF